MGGFFWGGGGKVKLKHTQDSKPLAKAKSCLGWASGEPPTQLSVGGAMISKPLAIAECMNQYFIRKVRNIIENLPNNNQDPLVLVRNLMKNRTCKFSLKSVHTDDIGKII